MGDVASLAGESSGSARHLTALNKSGTPADANRLMMAALAILDRHRHHIAAARLDSAIVELGLRPENEGMPPYEDFCDR